jgi:type IV fimbrial biogenesis protein FimT
MRPCPSLRRYHTRRPSPVAKRALGLTLIELLVAIAVLAIVAIWAVPGFHSLSARNEVAAEVLRLKSALAMARNAAITRRTTISVCPRPSPDSTSCDFLDWTHPVIVVEGQAPGGGLDEVELLKVVEGSGGPSVTFNRDYPIRYQATGWARGHNGTFEICGRHGRGTRVVVSNMGRVRVGEEAPDCPTP